MSYLSTLEPDNDLWVENFNSTILQILHSTRLQKQRTTFYPSDSLCSRKQVLEMSYEYESDSPAFVRYAAALGNATELWLTKELLSNVPEMVFAYDLAVNSKVNGFDEDEWLNYSGKIDLILNDMYGDIVVCDVKTYGKELRMEAYTAQLQFYAAITGAKKAAILAFSRNLMINGRFAFDVIPINVSKQEKIDAMTVAYYGQLAYDSGVLPEKPKHFRKTKECKYCFFKKECWDKTVDIYFKPDENLHIYEEAVRLAEQFVETPGRLERFIKSVEQGL